MWRYTTTRADKRKNQRLSISRCHMQPLKKDLKIHLYFLQDKWPCRRIMFEFIAARWHTPGRLLGAVVGEYGRV